MKQNALIPYDENNDDVSLSAQGYIEKSSLRKLIPPFSSGLNVELTAGQSFAGKGAPITSFENPVIDDLQRDCFWSLFLFRFGVLPDAPEGREINRMLLEWLWNDPTFDAKRFLLIGRQISSAAMAYIVTQELLKDPDIGAAAGMMAKAESMRQQAQDLEDQANGGQEQEEEGPGYGDGMGEDEDQEETGDYEGESDSEKRDGEPDDADNLRQEAQDLRDRADKLQQKAQKKVEQMIGDEFSSMLSAGAIKQGADVAEEIADFLSSWGYEEGQGINLSIEEIREIMKLMGTPGLAHLTSLMGRVYGVAIGVLQGRAPVEIMVQTGGYTQRLHDIKRGLLPFLSQKAPEPIRREFTKRYLQRGLPGVTRSSQAKQEGAFIWACDESGSMSGRIPVDEQRQEFTKRHTIAKALCLGLARAARDNGQEFHMFGFSTTGEITDIVTHQSSLGDLIHFASHAFDGGTDFDYALNRAMDIFDGLDEEDKRSADLGMTTDGEADVDKHTIERLLNLKDRYGVRFHLLLIDDASMGEIEQIADNVLQFNDLHGVAQVLATAMWQ